MACTIALAGNPNSGKTTLFNVLTGSHQYVGNWPGVTVERKEGTLKGDSETKIVDLPGIYSLSPYTTEEVVTRNYLLDGHPDVILNIVDATNLERNLYLTTQLLEVGLPMVIALNMMDVLRKNGDTIQKEALEETLGCPVVEISAIKGEGLAAAEAAIRAAKAGVSKRKTIYAPALLTVLHRFEETYLSTFNSAQRPWFAVKLFERDRDMLTRLPLQTSEKEAIEKEIAAVETVLEDDAESLIVNARYDAIEEIMEKAAFRKNSEALSLSDKIDRIVTNRILGLPIFAVAMFLVYWIAMVGVGQPATDWTNEVLFEKIVPDALGGVLASLGTAEWLSGLILDGIVAGVGGVLGFVPQMFVLFFLLAFLEGSGYMARIAFVLDRIFRRFGLSGKSFIPMLIGTGCGVPAIMASRTIESERDRRMTIMTTTFIPCSAKLTFIAFLAGALFNGSATVATSGYFLGMASIIISGIMLKKTKPFTGDPSPFVMELPAYHMPTLKMLLRSTWQRGSAFIKKAGTIILLSTIVIWFLSRFGFTAEGFHMLAEEELDHSMLAAFGNTIAWLFTPLGWGNWRAAVATVTGLVAKEEIVSTIGVLYGGEEVATSVFAASFTALAGYSFLVFNLLCAPCFAAIGAIQGEMNDRKWTWFAVLYQCGFAYAIALIIYQVGLLFTGAVELPWLIFALVVLGLMLYLLFRPAPKALSTAQGSKRTQTMEG